MSRETTLPAAAAAGETTKRLWNTPTVITETAHVTEKTSNFRDSVPTGGGRDFYAGPS